MNTPARYRDANVFDKLALLTKLGGQNGIILPCMITGVTRVDKAMIVANGHRAEICHMNRRQNSSR